MQIVESERTFEIVVGGVRLRGRIDVAQRTPSGGLAILDYKTGRARDEDEADKSLQLSVYAIASQELFGELPERIGFYNFENNLAAETTRSQDDLAKTRAKVIEVASAICAGKFGPKEGGHCAWCGYRDLCPAKEEPLYSIASALPAKAGN
jgi:RecB family exonuclease